MYINEREADVPVSFIGDAMKRDDAWRKGRSSRDRTATVPDIDVLLSHLYVCVDENGEKRGENNVPAPARACAAGSDAWFATIGTLLAFITRRNVFFRESQKRTVLGFIRSSFNASESKRIAWVAFAAFHLLIGAVVETRVPRLAWKLDYLLFWDYRLLTDVWNFALARVKEMTVEQLSEALTLVFKKMPRELAEWASNNKASLTRVVTRMLNERRAAPEPTFFAPLSLDELRSVAESVGHVVEESDAEFVRRVTAYVNTLEEMGTRVNRLYPQVHTHLMSERRRTFLDTSGIQLVLMKKLLDVKHTLEANANANTNATSLELVDRLISQVRGDDNVGWSSEALDGPAALAALTRRKASVSSRFTSVSDTFTITDEAELTRGEDTTADALLAEMEERNATDLRKLAERNATDLGKLAESLARNETENATGNATGNATWPLWWIQIVASIHWPSSLANDTARLPKGTATSAMYGAGEDDACEDPMRVLERFFAMPASVSPPFAVRRRRDGTGAHALALAHSYVSRAPSERAEAFLRALDEWNAVTTKNGQTRSHADKRHISTRFAYDESATVGDGCVDANDLMGAMRARVPNFALSYTADHPTLKNTSACGLLRFEGPAGANTVDCDDPNERAQVRDACDAEAFAAILKDICEAWDGMRFFNTKNGQKNMRARSRHDTSHVVWFVFRDEDAGEIEAVVPILRHQPSLTDIVAVDELEDGTHTSDRQANIVARYGSGVGRVVCVLG